MHINDICNLRIDEGLGQWKSEKWVHYSDFEMLKIATGIRDAKSGKAAGFHQDPAGIYFFPEDYSKIASMWRQKRYKFTVTLKPDARILDYETITDEQLDQIVERTGTKDELADYLKQFPPADRHNHLRMAWSVMRQRYMKSVPAAWNKAIRECGWDAIFDDSGSIHSSEVQLLVLDPRIIATIDRTVRKGRGYSDVMMVYNEVKRYCAPYGIREDEPPRLQKNRYSGAMNLAAEVVVGDEDNYARFKIEIDAADRNRNDIVTVRLEYSSMYFNSSPDSAAYNINSKKWDDYHTLEKAMAVLKKIFVAKDENE